MTSKVFDARSTADEVLDGIDLNGVTALVTGSSGGIGLETVRALASHGAHVVMGARDNERNSAAAAGVVAAHPTASVATLELDLASLASVRQAAARFLDDHGQLQLLINNAGVMCTPKGRTADGFETQFGTNHLGHFLLTGLLVPVLLAGAPARVVNVSSSGHSFSNVDLEDPNFERSEYDGWLAYGRSKSANVLMAVELDRRLKDSGVRAFAVHPGGIHTDLGRYMTASDLAILGARMEAAIDTAAAAGGSGGFEWKSVPQGAATSVWAATSPSLDGTGGLYLEDCRVSRPKTVGGTFQGYEPYVLDPETATALWRLSETLVGQEFAP